jgi:hypothetical protein
VLIREFVAKNLPFGTKPLIMSKFLLPLLLIAQSVLATDPYLRNPNIDIKQYTFQFEVNDSTDMIASKASVTVLLKKQIADFLLDLTNKNTQGLGMMVSSVSFQHRQSA